MPLEVSERATDYLDRYLTVHSVTSHHFHMAASAALLVAVKQNDQLPVLSTRKLVRLAERSFPPEGLVEMERKVRSYEWACLANSESVTRSRS